MDPFDNAAEEILWPTYDDVVYNFEDDNGYEDPDDVDYDYEAEALRDEADDFGYD